MQGYPTIKIFPPGEKSDAKSLEYEGPREEDGIVKYALDKLEQFGFVPDTPQ